MGTRGIYGFRKNEVDKLTYNHYDSYPEVLGRNIVEFIGNHTIEELNKIYDKIIMVDNESIPTEEQIKECEKYTDLSVSQQTTQDWYCLLRDTQGDLSAYDDDLKYMIDNADFILDGLFCEYGYIINLDTNRLEIYRGGQKEIDPTNRYTIEDEVAEENMGYYPCKMVAEIDLKMIQGLDDTRKQHYDFDDLVANIVDYCNLDEKGDEI